MALNCHLNCLFSTRSAWKFLMLEVFLKWNQFTQRWSLEKSHVPKIKAIHKLVDPFLTMSTSQSLTKTARFWLSCFSFQKSSSSKSDQFQFFFVFVCRGRSFNLNLRWGWTALFFYFYFGEIYLASRKKSSRNLLEVLGTFLPNKKSIPKLRAQLENSRRWSPSSKLKLASWNWQWNLLISNRKLHRLIQGPWNPASHVRAAGVVFTDWNRWDSAALNLFFGEHFIVFFAKHSASKSKSMEFSEAISTLRIWPTSDYMLKRGPLRQVPWRGGEESWKIQSVVYQGERLSDCQCNLVALLTSVKSTSIFEGKKPWWISWRKLQKLPENFHQMSDPFQTLMTWNPGWLV